MHRITKSTDFTYCRTNNANNQVSSLMLSKAIEDIENFFLHEKEGELYEFILKIIEKPLIEKVLHNTEGNQCKAAKILGINRNTLRTKIQKLKINVEDFK